MNIKSVLLVEDNPDDELLTLEALSANGIKNNIAVARDGVEAIDYLFGQGKFDERDKNDLPAVILLDLKLPRMDGIEVLKRIREEKTTCMVPVVLLTSSREEEDRIKGYKLGANSFVRKPVNFDDFVKVSAQIGMYWLLVNEPPPQ